MSANNLLIPIEEILLRMGELVAPSADQLAKYTSWAEGLSRAFRDYCHWNLSRETGIVRYYSGCGDPNLILSTPYTVNDDDLEVIVDQTGAWGQGPSAFTGTPLVKGTDYALIVEGEYGKSGLLQRLGGGGTVGFPWPSEAFWNPSLKRGLSYGGVPFWPVGQGNVKVTCSTGWTAADMPESIKLALAGGMRVVQNFVLRGWPVTSESLGDYSYSASIGQFQEFATVVSYLRRFRDWQV